MHGDREVSTKNLARHARREERSQPCAPAVADRHSGYQVGGTSPFGTRRAMPVYMQRDDRRPAALYVNGGRRGYLVGMAPADLVRVLQPDAGRHRDRAVRLRRASLGAPPRPAMALDLEPVQRRRARSPRPTSRTPASAPSFATRTFTHGAPNSPSTQVAPPSAAKRSSSGGGGSFANAFMRSTTAA